MKTMNIHKSVLKVAMLLILLGMSASAGGSCSIPFFTDEFSCNEGGGTWIENIVSKAEPTNYPTNFTAITNSTSQITTSWTDATGAVTPDSYLVMCSTSSNGFTNPSDGTAQNNDTSCADGSGVQNIAQGTQTVSWTGLNAGTQYFFKIFPFSNTGGAVNYKVDESPLTANATTVGYSISIAKTTDGAENSGGTPTDAVYTITVSPSNNSGTAITGNIAYTGTATNGTDYATGATTFSIANGQSTATITLDVTEDTSIEGTETAIATISSPSAGSIGTAAATANITDDDFPNNIPTSSNQSVSIDEDTNKTFSSNDFPFTDIDTGDSLESIIISSLATKGILSLNDVNVTLNQSILSSNISQLVFSPIANENGTPYSSFGFKVNDGEDNSTAYTMSINVNAINDAPSLNTNYVNINMNEDQGRTSYDVNVSDSDSSELNITVESNNTSILTVTPNWNGELNSTNWNQEFNLTTVANAHGVVEIKVRVSDGELNATKTFEVTVIKVVSQTGGNTNPISGLEEAKSNNALVYIGFHANRPTVSDITEEHLEDIMPSIMNINTSNMEAYNAYIDANPDSFSSPAIASEVQVMVDSVNAQVLSANTEEAPNTSDNNTTTSESNTTAEESSEENLSN